jgi:hypothetical protein
MKPFLAGLTIFLLLSSCGIVNRQTTLTRIKDDLNCVEISKETEWTDIRTVLGEADIYPIPEQDRLDKNTRIYKSKLIIFYVENQKHEIDGKIRFREVITRIELCEQ